MSVCDCARVFDCLTVFDLPYLVLCTVALGGEKPWLEAWYLACVALGCGTDGGRSMGTLRLGASRTGNWVDGGWCAAVVQRGAIEDPYSLIRY